MPSPLDFTLTFAVAVAVGVIVLLLGTKIIAGLRLPFGNAFWMSFIAHIFTSMISLGFGLVLAGISLGAGADSWHCPWILCSSFLVLDRN